MERASGNFALKAHFEELNHIRRIITDLNKNIRALSRTEEYRENVRLLKTAPGICTLTAMKMLTELHHIGRFSSLDKFASYVGIIPDTDSSGETDIATGITKRRNPELRVMLIESSWIAVRKDPALMMAFEHLTKNMKGTKAIIHTAKKLLNRIRFISKNQMEYVPAVVQ
jgi:transposase